MFKENYAEYKDLINAHIMDYFPEVDYKSKIVYDAIEEGIMPGGKRIRPVLLLAACEFCGGDVKKALPYACAVEYIHCYSLMHDDLPALDDDDYRRGKPTVHKTFGEGIALLAGDGLLNAAFEIICKDMFLNFDNPTGIKSRIKALNEIAKGSGCRGLVAGQIADIEAENKTCSKEMMSYIHTNKTGALIVAAIRAGAYLGKATEEQIADLTLFAEAIGLGFQLKDDLLDIEGDPSKTGKDVGSDVNKCTYIKVFGLENTKEEINLLNEKARTALEKYGDKAGFFYGIIDELARRED